MPRKLKDIWLRNGLGDETIEVRIKICDHSGEFTAEMHGETWRSFDLRHLEAELSAAHLNAERTTWETVIYIDRNGRVLTTERSVDSFEVHIAPTWEEKRQGLEPRRELKELYRSRRGFTTTPHYAGMDTPIIAATEEDLELLERFRTITTQLLETAREIEKRRQKMKDELGRVLASGGGMVEAFGLATLAGEE